MLYLGGLQDTVHGVGNRKSPETLHCRTLASNRNVGQALREVEGGHSPRPCRLVIFDDEVEIPALKILENSKPDKSAGSKSRC